MGYHWDDDPPLAPSSSKFDEDASDVSFPPPPYKSRSYHPRGSHRSPPAVSDFSWSDDLNPSPPPQISYTPPQRSPPCPGFPYHTSAAFYLSNLIITCLVLLALLTGLEAVPGSTPARFRRIAFILMGALVGAFLMVHVATPIGAFDTFLGAFGVTGIFCLAGAAPVLLFSDFREILHFTSQPWLLSPHILRILHFLFLPLYDINLLPLALAGPAGWGGLLIGLTAPVVALAFATKRSFAKWLATGWAVAGIAQLLLFMGLEAAFIPPFIAQRDDRRMDSGYIWHTVFLVLHFSVPVLLVLHGYSLWKLYVDKSPRPTMLWQEEDDADLDGIYGPDSPGAQDADMGAFEQMLRDASANSYENSLRPRNGEASAASGHEMIPFKHPEHTAEAATAPEPTQAQSASPTIAEAPPASTPEPSKQ